LRYYSLVVDAFLGRADRPSDSQSPSVLSTKAFDPTEIVASIRGELYLCSLIVVVKSPSPILLLARKNDRDGHGLHHRHFDQSDSGQRRLVFAQPQPVTASLRVSTSIANVGDSDDLSDGKDYSLIYAAGLKLDSAEFRCLTQLSEEMCRLGLEAGAGNKITITVHLPAELLQSDGVVIEAMMEKGHAMKIEALYVKNLRVSCIIGLTEAERVTKQVLVLNLRMEGSAIGEKDQNY
jgi:dihydroneopterin aldolase